MAATFFASDNSVGTGTKMTGDLRGGCRLGLLLGGGCRLGLLLGGGCRLGLLLGGGGRLVLLLWSGCRIVLRMQRDDAEQQEKENIFKTSHGR